MITKIVTLIIIFVIIRALSTGGAMPLTKIDR